MAESEEELKSLLKKVKEEGEKAGIKINIQKTKIMASGPITSWQIDREIVETVADLIFLGAKITANGDCNHEIKRHLLQDFPVAQTVKNLPARQEARVRSMDWEVPLEKEMATHSSILAWKILWTEEPGKLLFMGSQRVRHD